MNRQLSLLIQQQNQLVNTRLDKKINTDKETEFQDREAKLKLELDACALGSHETAEIANKAFELP